MSSAVPAERSLESVADLAWRLRLKFTTQERANFLHVFPSLALFVRRAQQVGRVKRRQHLDVGNARIILELAAHLADARFDTQQTLRRRIAERHDQARVYGS